MIRATFESIPVLIAVDFTAGMKDTYLTIYNDGNTTATNVRVFINGKPPSQYMAPPNTEIIPHYDNIEIPAKDKYEYKYREYVPNMITKNYRIQILWTDEISDKDKKYQKDFNRDYLF